MDKLCSKYVQNMCKLCSKCVQNMLIICSKYVKKKRENADCKQNTTNSSFYQREETKFDILCVDETWL